MAEGALLKAMLSAAMAARSDPGRFGRGKSYIRDGSVTSLEVGVGVLSGNVAGSRRVPYEVEVRVPTLGQRAFEMLEDGTKGLKDLVPGAREIRCTCSCPDDVTTCKHAVAVVLAFAEQLTVRPELLVDWRGGDTDTTIPDEPQERSRFDAPIRATRSVDAHRRAVEEARRARRPEPPPPPPLDPDVAAFLGHVPHAASLPDLPVLHDLPIVAVHFGEVDVSEVLEDALFTLRTTLPR